MNSYKNYLIERPEVEINSSGSIYNKGFNQSYHSDDGAVAESKYVFLDGIRLDELFSKKNHLTIAEIGFGTGLNFLLCVKEFEDAKVKPRLFNYLAFEKFPLSETQLINFFRQINEELPLKDELIENLKYLNPGVNKILFSKEGITLTLVIGDANEEISNITANVDAWFFDGFSPKANPTLWSNKLIRHCKNISNSNTVFASFSCAKYFKDNLTGNSCNYRKIKGFKNKREMLIGSIPNESSSANKMSADKISIVGAGLAGAFLAYSLSKRGVPCTVYEKEAEIGTRASGNPVGIFRPDITPNPNTRNIFFYQSYLTMLRWLMSNKEYWNEFECNLNGVNHFLHKKNLKKLYDNFPSELDDFPFIQKNENKTFYYPLSGTLNPKKLCTFLLDSSPLIKVKCNSNITEIKTKDDKVELVLENENVSTSKVVLANAYLATKLLDGLDLIVNKGQLAYFNSTLDGTYCYGGYAANFEDKVAMGGSFEHNVDTLDINPKQNSYMVNKYNNFISKTKLSEEMIVGGRAEFRTTNCEKTPIGSKLKPNVYCSLAHGSKGITTAFHTAESVIGMILNEPREIKN